MSTDRQASPPSAVATPVIVLSWLWVGVPFAWGLYELILKAKNLFGG
ncbi:MFS transporter small subunit [Rhodococcoides corynebacterioides]|uniref:Oxalate:formate antiporter n=1 Tax=Rhodococcoides corynebacterioides TaxID=53972 RepID=A0ABS7P2B2_9NOCA|nr:hypothetical protein [Rhodococcus corynebacterioides]MBY6366440.1 hypothetical protein [Rhodococcus corynebacterioides]MBY6407040.1 hypothetical protein [Rhodococcus corynebacterioides]